MDLKDTIRKYFENHGGKVRVLHYEWQQNGFTEIVMITPQMMADFSDWWMEDAIDPSPTSGSKSDGICFNFKYWIRDKFTKLPEVIPFPDDWDADTTDLWTTGEFLNNLFAVCFPNRTPTYPFYNVDGLTIHDDILLKTRTDFVFEFKANLMHLNAERIAFVQALKEANE